MAFSGQIAPLPLGARGLTGSKNLALIRPDQLIQANNITYEAGTLQKEGGRSKYNSSAISGAPSILAGWDWIPAGTTQRMIIVASNGNMYRDTGDGSFGTTLKTGLTVTGEVPVFVEGGKELAAQSRKLFCFTGKNAVQVLTADGTTTSDISTPPSDWSSTNQPTFGFIHEDRLWGGGNANDPHRLYYSITTDHEDMTGSGSGSLPIYSGEGEKIVQAMSFKGLAIVWKYPRGVYVVDTTDPTVGNWKISRISQSIGGISPLGAVAVDDDVIYMDAHGELQILSATTAFGNLGTRSLSDIAQMDELARVEFNLSDLSHTRGIFYPAKRQAHFAVAGVGNTVNNRRLIVDFNNPELPRFALGTKDTCEALWLRKDNDGIPRPVCGGDDGFVYTMDEETRSDAGVGYEGLFQTPHLDFAFLDPRLGAVRKNGMFLELIMEPVGNFDLNVDIYWDDELSETITFNQGSTGAVLGAFVLGTSVLAGSNLVNKKKRVRGSGRRFSFAARNSAAGETFSIAAAYFHFLVGDERNPDA